MLRCQCIKCQRSTVHCEVVVGTGLGCYLNTFLVADGN